MKTKLQLPLFTLLLTLLCLGLSSGISAQYVVDFEGVGETKGSYATATVTLSGLDWDMTETLIGSLAADFKNGLRSARFRGYGTSSMTMLEDKPNGIGEISFLYRRYGTDNQVDWRVEYSTDQGDSWTQIGADFTAPAVSEVQTFSETLNVEGNVRIRIKRATEDGITNRRLNIDDLTLTHFGPSTTTTYVYETGNWTPENPNGVISPVDDMQVMDGSATITADMELSDITIAAGASLIVEQNLKVSGNITNNGDLVFISNDTTTGQLDTFLGTISGSGAVFLERYIPARRAFRFLSSAVTTTSTINANWQEGSTGALDNPNPGFGTHITGSIDGLNGFDATPGGNPSLFTLDNTTQAWEVVTNTDVNTIDAGTAYRLFVRGDRSIDVTSNSAVPTNTTLRTSGTLHTGPFTVTALSEVENEFNFFGNPYPAAVNMNLVLTESSNVNSAFYYIWDPNLGARGAYVTIDLPGGTNASGSDGNQYLQPGQAAFVTTLANGAASLQFEENHKKVEPDLTAVFSTESKIDLRLYSAEAYSSGNKPSDGLRLKFSEDGTNAISSMDAPKFFNQDENLASSNDNRLWSIESRAMPLEGENIPLFINQYSSTDYVFEAKLNQVADITAVLRDHFTGTDTELINNETTLYVFNVEHTDSNSSAENRFEIVFVKMLNLSEVHNNNGFVMFPNPAKDSFTITAKSIGGENVTVSITNVLGQTLYNKSHTVDSNGHISIDTAALTQGIYTIKLIHTNGGQFTAKLIKK